MIRGIAAICLLSFAFAFGPTAPAAAAPPQLLNKTISLSWVNSGTGTRPDGKTINFNNNVSRTIYVSNQGRLFIRTSRSTARGAGTTRDTAPGDNISAQGLARDARFSGNKLIGTMAFASGAGQFVATFDGGFSSCSVSVVYGKSGGAGLRLKGPDGIMYDVKTMSAASPSCSIQAGNPFAGR